MKPYYSEKGITIYHGDFREIIPSIQKYAHLILTDPPYGIGVEYDGYKDTRENLIELLRTGFHELQLYSKRILLTCGVTNLTIYPQPDWVLAWVIIAGVSRCSWGFNNWSPILAYGPDPYLEIGMGCRPDIILQTETSNASNHPTPKPYGFWRKLLLRGSITESDLIIDPMMGSGTTLRVAKDTGRKCIGIDISERYCEIAAHSLQQEVLNWSENNT